MQQSPSTYAQDAAGNSLGIGSGAESYQVNERNQVNQIDGDAQTYLDQGNDLRRDHGSTRDLNSSLGVTATKTGSTTAYVVRDPNGDVVTYRDSTGKRFNYVTEPNGNVVWLTDSTGAQVGGYEYAPYGKAAVFGAEGAGNKFRWLGEQQNPDTSGRDGHYKFGARYYDLQGHFTQPDPLTGGMTDPRTMTGYNYAGGDPINQNDVTGLSTACNIGATTVGVLTFATVGTLSIWSGPGAVAAGGASAAVASGATKAGCESSASEPQLASDTAVGGLFGAINYGLGLIPGNQFQIPYPS